MHSTTSILAIIFAFIFPVVGLILAIVAKKDNPEDSLAKAAFIVSLVYLIIAGVYLLITILLICIPLVLAVFATVYSA